MPSPPHYLRPFARMTFLILFVVIVILPGLTTSQPKPYFAALRSILENVPLPLYGIIGLSAGGVLFVVHIGRRAAQRLNSSARSTATALEPLWTMPIEEAVLSKNGGNGLASRSFNLPAQLFTWVIIPTPGMECVIIDGQRVIRRTRLCAMPMQLLGRPTRARRVLLTPRPQMILPIKTLSRDRLDVQIQATVTYRLTDPRCALSQAPLEAFIQLVQGVLTEHIHAYEQLELVGDRGNLRAVLEEKLRKQRSMRGFEVIEVPIASIEGDMRLIEIGRQTRIEAVRSDLIEREGENRVKEERYTREIEQLRRQLIEWATNQAHNRDMERLLTELHTQNFGSVIEAAAAIALSGQNPQEALDAMQKMLDQSLSREGQAQLGLTIPISPEIALAQLPIKNVILTKGYDYHETLPTNQPRVDL